jgi:hypothetical protein
MQCRRRAAAIRRISSLPGSVIGCHERTMPQQRRLRGVRMITTSEYVVVVTIRGLTLAGVFFGGRAAWRRRRQKRAEGDRKPAE